jgi:hypothetical protein
MIVCDVSELDSDTYRVNAVARSNGNVRLTVDSHDPTWLNALHIEVPPIEYEWQVGDAITVYMSPPHSRSVFTAFRVNDGPVVWMEYDSGLHKWVAR